MSGYRNPGLVFGEAASGDRGACFLVFSQGSLLANLFPDLISGFHGFSFEPGIRLTSKKVLQLAVVLLGFEMNFAMIVKVGGQSLFVMLFTLTAAFVTAYVMGNLLHLDGKTTTLIGVGTAICGGSAIAATAPVIAADDEEVASAISTIFLFNVVAVFIFPAWAIGCN